MTKPQMIKIDNATFAYKHVRKMASVLRLAEKFFANPTIENLRKAKNDSSLGTSACPEQVLRHASKFTGVCNIVDCHFDNEPQDVTDIMYKMLKKIFTELYNHDSDPFRQFGATYGAEYLDYKVRARECKVMYQYLDKLMKESSEKNQSVKAKKSMFEIGPNNKSMVNAFLSYGDAIRDTGICSHVGEFLTTSKAISFFKSQAPFDGHRGHRGYPVEHALSKTETKTKNFAPYSRLYDEQADKANPKSTYGKLRRWWAYNLAVAVSNMPEGCFNA